jgi:hypothetical protein
VDGPSLKKILDSLEAEVLLDTGEIEEDQMIRAEVELRNVGIETVEFASGRPLAASLLETQTRTRVGGFVGLVAGVGVQITLGVGDTNRLTVLIGTHCGDHNVRRALLPGTYLVQVRVPIHTLSSDHSSYETSYAEAPLVEIRITPRDQMLDGTDT